MVLAVSVFCSVAFKVSQLYLSQSGTKIPKYSTFQSRSWEKLYILLGFSLIQPIFPIYFLNFRNIQIFICIFGSSGKLTLNCFSIGFVYAVCICISYLVCFFHAALCINGNVHVPILFHGFLYRSISICFPHFLLCHCENLCCIKLFCWYRTCNPLSFF